MRPYRSILPAPANWRTTDSLFQHSRTPFDTSSPIPKRRGPLTIVACSTCRRKRTKCDGHRPVCFACADAGFEAAAECFYDVEQGVTRCSALRKEYSELTRRVSLLGKFFRFLALQSAEATARVIKWMREIELDQDVDHFLTSDGPNRLLLSKPGDGDHDVEVPKSKATESYIELGAASINDEVDILFEDL
ncbi:hypothetical protein EV126DRAFT_412813 [Verticillium dahliae]|nr:hypothetical protein EV126DRAFT_412813 [Verticillium dahliae]